MDRLLRHAAPLILLGLAIVVWFERSIPGAGWFAATFGPDTVLRVVTGAACVYLAVLIAERRQMAKAFQQVLVEFRRFHDAAGPASTDSGRSGRELSEILLGALRSDDPEIRRTARAHLGRLCGADHGDEPDAWRGAVDARFPRS